MLATPRGKCNGAIVTFLGIFVWHPVLFTQSLCTKDAMKSLAGYISGRSDVSDDESNTRRQVTYFTLTPAQELI